MATMITPENFEPLRELAKTLIEAARELSLVTTIPATSLSQEREALLYEAESFSLALQALALESSLDEESLLVAIGGAVGTIVAQCQTDHAKLLWQMRRQEGQTYDEVVRATKPVGGMQ